jgi:hypothetical protein
VGESGASSAPPPALPAGTVTFLFTDIEGSTRLAERRRAAMPAAQARHGVLLGLAQLVWWAPWQRVARTVAALLVLPPRG